MQCMRGMASLRWRAEQRPQASQHNLQATSMDITLAQNAVRSGPAPLSISARCAAHLPLFQQLEKYVETQLFPRAALERDAYNIVVS